MKLGALVRAGLRHHWRMHLGVLFGAAIATATLVGALVVGDSVRGTLARRAGERIGSVDLALVAGDRTFRSALADELATDGDRATALLVLPGVLSTADRPRRVHDVGVLGVDRAFFELSPSGTAIEPPASGQGLLSQELARRLDVEVGERLVLRVDRPSAIPRDMALAPDDVTQAIRFEVAGVVDDQDFGRFALHGGHVAPANLFLDREWLAEELELDEGGSRANLLLVDVAGELEAGRSAVEQRLSAAWSLDDAELVTDELTDVATIWNPRGAQNPTIDVPTGTSELATKRIFFDEPVIDALSEADDVDLTGVFTYFVNALKAGDRSTPYSMVTGLGALSGELPADWAALVPTSADGVVVNRWLADDLALEVGAELEIDYWVVASSGRLVEQSHAFTIERIVELSGAAADPSWMPAFPGLADADSCREWEPGTPVDLDRIRDEDEDYWDEHRGTPKAFIQLERARELWSSRFGTLSAVRFANEAEDAVRARVRTGIEPAQLGLVVRDVRTPALAASQSPTDFGGLFIGLSFFLIVAALLLTTQLFLFGVESRSHELGLFAAVGYPRRRVARVVLTEVFWVALLGGLVGLPFGLLYTRGVLYGLTSVWAGAVAGVELDFHVQPVTLVIGVGSALVATLVTVAFAARRWLARPVVQLIGRRGGVEAVGPLAAEKRAAHVALIPIAIAIAWIVVTDPNQGAAAATAFFGAGAFLLIGGLVLVRAYLRAGPRSQRLHSVAELGRLRARRRPGRSLATVALMAIGTFLVLAVGVNRIGPAAATAERSSGTGGFAFYGRTSLAVVHDLDSADGQDFFALSPDEMQDVAFVPLRLRSGDDASCLNLARPDQPTLLGVDPEELAERGAFQFANTIVETEDPWRLLNGVDQDGAIPAIGDTTSLTWQLKKSTGDKIGYVDERGEPFEVVIVGAIADTILQGDLIIASEHFERLYPTEGGHRRFLVDAPFDSAGDSEAGSADEAAVDRRAELRTTLERALSDVGLSLEPAEERLDAFHQVQNTYLTIFELLGALGVLLGGVGLGAVCLRNTIERRAELALTAALGYTARRIRWLVVSEYSLLLLFGALVGGVAALAAVAPSAVGSSTALTRAAGMIVLIAINGLVWILLAARSVDVRTPQVVLREE